MQRRILLTGPPGCGSGRYSRPVTPFLRRYRCGAGANFSRRFAARGMWGHRLTVGFVPRRSFSLKVCNRFFRKENSRGGFGYVVPCAQSVPSDIYRLVEGILKIRW
jgi:hypothetical protein